MSVCFTQSSEQNQEVHKGLKKHNDEFNTSYDGTPITITASENDVFLGAINAKRNFNTLHIESIYVDPTRQKKGIGRKLVERVESYAEINSLNLITLTTLAHQAPKFYEKLGYTEFAQIPNYIGNNAKYYFIKRFDV